MGAIDLEFDSSDVLKEADRALLRGDWPAGRRGYESVLARDPENLGAKAGIEFVEFLEGGRKSRFYFLIEGTSEELWERRFANEALNKKEFRAGKTRVESRPSTCHIEHTTRCNFHCPHCTKGYDPYLGVDLSQEVIDKALDALLPDLITADLTGFGEPTVGSQYGHLMKRLTEKGVMPQMNTNTSTLTIPHIELLVRSHARVTLSIDGATRETFESIRAGGSWDNLLYSLHGIRRIRGIYESGGTKFGRFTITFVAMRNNIHELPDMVRMTDAFSLDQLLVQDYLPEGISFDEQSLRSEPARANRYFDEAERLAKELGVNLLLPPRYAGGVPSPTAPAARRFLSTKRLFPKPGRFPARCAQPWKNTRVKYDGEVTPCCFSMRAMGDLNKQDFDRIWNGWRYRFFRWRIQTFCPPPECRQCHVYEGINRGNPGNVKIHEGLLLKVLYYLEDALTRLIHRATKRKEPPPNFYKGKPLKRDAGGV